MYFGLTCDDKLDGRKIICVGCGSADIELFSYDEDIELRIKELALEISEIKTRIECLEDGFISQVEEIEPDDENAPRKKLFH